LKLVKIIAVPPNSQRQLW